MNGAISVKNIVRNYLASKSEKDWGGHDRASTVGASDIGQCERRVYFTKNAVPQDPDFVQRYGAMERGNLIENHLVVPALAAALGSQLIRAGEEQQTIVDGYLSATPDAVLIDLAPDCLAHLGIDDIGPSQCIALEIKSIDPRVDIKKAKAEHAYQTQVQMGLLRHATNHHPDYALIAYIDASFVDDVNEFVVRFDPAIYQAAQDRARRIMTAHAAVDLAPEGKMAGGNECRYCAWSSHCADVTVAGIPYDNSNPSLDEDDIDALEALIRLERASSDAIDDISVELAARKQSIKDFLREHGIRRYHTDEWSVAWSSSKGRVTVDAAMAEAAGIDLEPFRKEGQPGDRLIVKVK
jgi:hypothetical protein